MHGASLEETARQRGSVHSLTPSPTTHFVGTRPLIRLRVRMALHTGLAQQREGDFFGPTLNRLARLLELAHGGQVLVSEACGALVAEEPGGVGLLDLGEFWLRDLRRPERVFQVIHPELPASFPPVRATAAERQNL